MDLPIVFIAQLIAFAGILISTTESSYCGQAAIPFSFEAGFAKRSTRCARPSCFGWNADGRRSADSAQFYRVGKMADGFLRAADAKGPAIKNASGFQPQYSICDRSYISEHCSGTSWVGGIAPSAKIDSSGSMKLMCCSYNKLSESVNEGQEEIRAGQIIKGGEVKNEDGRQYSFEYIANIQRLFDRNGVVYILTMKRFPCVPDSIPPITVESDAAKFLIENINAMGSRPAEYAGNSKPKASFDEQKFELPEDMPQEAPNKHDSHSDSSIKSEDYGSSDTTESFPQQQVSEDKQSVGSGNNRLGIPSARAMGDETEGVGVPLSATKLLSQLDDKTADYQKSVPIPTSPGFSQQQIQQGSINSNNGPAYYSQQQAPQSYNYYGYQQQPYFFHASQQYPQQQYYNGGLAQQPTSFHSMLDPLGMFRALTPQYNMQQQFQPQQSPTMPAFIHVTPTPFPPPQDNSNAYSSGKISGSESQNSDVAVEQRSSGPTPLSPAISFGTPSHTSQSIPLPRIPSPEEIEDALPAASKQLIATVTRTLLGYNRFI